MTKIDTKFLNDVPVDQRLERMKHYYLRSRKSEREAEVVRAQVRRAEEKMAAIELRLARYYEMAEEILQLEGPA